jgi:hypothetical protein
MGANDKKEISNLKSKIEEYEKIILSNKDKYNSKKNKNLFIRKTIEYQQRKINELLIKLSLEKTKTSTDLINLLNNISNILQKFSEVSKNHSDKDYLVNIQKILDELKSSSLNIIKQINTQKLNKNNKNYNEIISNLKDIITNILSEIK